MNGRINRQPIETALELPLSDLEWMRAQWLDNPHLDPLTLTNYSRKTDLFVEWWTQAGPAHNWQLTRSALQGFSNWLASKKSRHSTQGQMLSFNTRKSVVNHVMQLLQWAKQNDIVVGIDFTGWFPAIPGAPAQRKAATADQLTQLMTAALDSRYPTRDQAILAFFIGTGCRLQEVALLTFESLHFEGDGSGTALVRGKRTQANPTGRRNVAFDAATGKYLTAHIKWERITAGALWLNERGEPFAQAGIYQMVSRTVKRAELAGVIRGCHDLRRAFATILGLMHPDSPAWADMIRRQLGHASYSMTAHYTLLSADDIRARIRSPLAPSA
jgi:integrase